MPSAKRPHADDLRGASRLVIEATKRVTDVVEGMHVTIASGPAILGKPLAAPVRAIAGLVYGSIRGITHVVGASVDAALAGIAPLIGGSAPGPQRLAFLAALNGVVGDHLAATNNPLAVEAALCHRGESLPLDAESLARALPEANGKLLVLVHGCAMSDVQWTRDGHDHGAALARDLGYTPVYFRYNTGLHISTNGRTFAEHLERLTGAWPTAVDELVIVAHSMGGLVTRSACEVAETEGYAWRAKLHRLVTLGTPHHGAPLERGGNWVEFLLGVSPYSAPLSALARLRSAGVTDLRYGNIHDEHWNARDRFALSRDPRKVAALPQGVRCYAIAGTLGSSLPDAFLGDGLVPVDSALGRHRNPSLALDFPEQHRWVAPGVPHLQLLSRPEVYARLREWLAE